jgi:hypothetical protein
VAEANAAATAAGVAAAAAGPRRSSRPDAVPVRTEVDGNGTPDGDAARNGDGETSHGGNGNIPA